MSRDWEPGDLVVILPSRLVDKLGSNSQQFTRGLTLALVVSRSHRWSEPNSLQFESHRYYIVFIDGRVRAATDEGDEEEWVSPGLYTVPGNSLIDTSEANNPARLFGTWRLVE